MEGVGLSLQIFDVHSKILLDQFLLDAYVRSVGALDTGLNNPQYNYVTVTRAVATPWYQSNPLRPIGFDEGYLKIEDILLLFPMEAEAQAKIQKMPRSEAIIVYLERFVIHGNLSMGQDTPLSGVLDALDKRLITISNVSVYPMFPASTAMPEHMPIALLNRDKITHYHPSR